LFFSFVPIFLQSFFQKTNLKLLFQDKKAILNLTLFVSQTKLLWLRTGARRWMWRRLISWSAPSSFSLSRAHSSRNPVRSSFPAAVIISNLGKHIKTLYKLHTHLDDRRLLLPRALCDRRWRHHSCPWKFTCFLHDRRELQQADALLQTGQHAPSSATLVVILFAHGVETRNPEFSKRKFETWCVTQKMNSFYQFKGSDNCDFLRGLRKYFN